MSDGASAPLLQDDLDALEKDTVNHRSKSFAAQVRSLDLKPHQKLFIAHVHHKYAHAYQEGRTYRKLASQTQMAYNICAGSVPILIPFSQMCRDTTFEFWWTFNIGVIISIVATMCSLAAAVVNAKLQSQKPAEQSFLYDREANDIERELNLLLSQAGAYTGKPHNTAYTEFIERYNQIRKENERCQLFGEVVTSSGIGSQYRGAATPGAPQLPSGSSERS